MTDMRPRIIVAIAPGQPEAVVIAAGRLAHGLGADLVCAWVDPSQYTVTSDDGADVTTPLDPDAGDVIEDWPDTRFEDELHRLLDHHDIDWEIRSLGGAPTLELTRLADKIDAAMIVVGTRNHGIGESLREFFTGSVAVQLAHRQHRPIVVVPLEPVGLETALPWEADEQ